MSPIGQADPAGQRRGMGASGRSMRSARERLELVETGPAAFGRAGGDSRHWAAAGFPKKDPFWERLCYGYRPISVAKPLDISG